MQNCSNSILLFDLKGNRFCFFGCHGLKAGAKMNLFVLTKKGADKR